MGEYQFIQFLKINVKREFFCSSILSMIFKKFFQKRLLRAREGKNNNHRDSYRINTAKVEAAPHSPKKYRH
jgi:hypothetical protein